MKFQKVSISILLILIFFLLADFVFAQKGPEVPLPSLGETGELPFLPDYVKYIFNFAIGISGLIAFVVLVFGGMRYLTSAGNPSTMSDANNQIFSAIVGLIVILSSYLLLTTINPQLIVINPSREPMPPAIEATGVFLCKTNAEETEGNCAGPYYQNLAVIPGDFYNEIRYIRFKNPADIRYGVVVHEDRHLRGNCEVILSLAPGGEVTMPINRITQRGGASSITVFKQDPSVSGGGVTLYRDTIRSAEEEQTIPKIIFTWGIGVAVSGLDSNVSTGIQDITRYKYNDGRQIEGNCPLNVACGDGVSAIKVDQGYMAILFEDKNYEGDKCEVFFEGTDANLSTGNAIGNDEARSIILIKGHR